MQKPIYVAIVSPKGGVGKTTLTMLAASNLHYTTDCHVAIVDCNYPLYPINRLRMDETAVVDKINRFKEKIQQQFLTTKKKSYRIVDTRVETALQAARKIHQKNKETDIILFDLPKLMEVDGTSELLSAMDLVIFPVTGSHIVTELTGRYIEILNEQVVTMGKSNIKATYLLPNMINSWEQQEADILHGALADSTGATLTEVKLPYTRQIRSDIFDTYYDVGISTLLPTAKRYYSLCAKELTAEIVKIIQELCGKS